MPQIEIRRRSLLVGGISGLTAAALPDVLQASTPRLPLTSSLDFEASAATGGLWDDPYLNEELREVAYSLRKVAAISFDIVVNEKKPSEEAIQVLVVRPRQELSRFKSHDDHLDSIYQAILGSFLFTDISERVIYINSDALRNLFVQVSLHSHGFLEEGRMSSVQAVAHSMLNSPEKWPELWTSPSNSITKDITKLQCVIDIMKFLLAHEIARIIQFKDIEIDKRDCELCLDLFAFRALMLTSQSNLRHSLVGSYESALALYMSFEISRELILSAVNQSYPDAQPLLKSHVGHSLFERLVNYSPRWSTQIEFSSSAAHRAQRLFILHPKPLAWRSLYSARSPIS